MQKLPEILTRIDERLADLNLNDSSASKRAGKPDAIRNARRAANSPTRQGITVGTLNALAAALETSLSWLADGQGPKEVSTLEPNATIEPSMVDLPRGGGARDLPVLGAAVGGGEYDGDFRLNGEVAEYTARPAMLSGRKKAFAVNLENTSMVPLYRPKQRIYVDPDGRKPMIGEEVLLEMYPEDDGVPGKAFVKTLVSRGAATIVVSQYNPPLELKFDARQVKQMLRVIPYEELLGI